jgi:hypothetical protein
MAEKGCDLHFEHAHFPLVSSSCESIMKVPRC